MPSLPYRPNDKDGLNGNALGLSEAQLFEGYDDGIYDHPIGTYDGDMILSPGMPLIIGVGSNSLVEV